MVRVAGWSGEMSSVRYPPTLNSHHDGELSPHQISYHLLPHLISLVPMCNLIPYMISPYCWVPAYVPLHSDRYLRNQICFAHKIAWIHPLNWHVATPTKSNNYTQLPSMPPKRMQRNQLHSLTHVRARNPFERSSPASRLFLRALTQ